MAIKFENPSPEDIQRTIEAVKAAVGHGRFVLVILNEDSSVSMLTRLPEGLADHMCKTVGTNKPRERRELHQQGGN